MCGAATAKARLPTVDNLTGGTTRRLMLVERSGRVLASRTSNLLSLRLTSDTEANCLLICISFLTFLKYYSGCMTECILSESYEWLDVIVSGSLVFV